eukprot:m.111702 g.111702  ORF g.111702 m.111702 type:complete len:310 (+) comp13457_c0_seq1:48-977(+)
MSSSGQVSRPAGSVNGGVLVVLLDSLQAELHDALDQATNQQQADIIESALLMCQNCTRQAMGLEAEVLEERKKVWSLERELHSISDHLEATVKRALMHKNRVGYLEKHTKDLQQRLKTVTEQADSQALNARTSKEKLRALQDAAALQSGARRQSLINDGANGFGRSSGASTLSPTSSSGTGSMLASHGAIMTKASSSAIQGVSAALPAPAVTKLKEDHRHLMRQFKQMEKELKDKDSEVARLTQRLQTSQARDTERKQLKQKVAELEAALQRTVKRQAVVKHQQKREKQEMMWQRLEQQYQMGETHTLT